jgi:menaquinone-9 beta-reductase
VNPTPLMTPALRLMGSRRFLAWAFGHYLRIAPPEFALGGPAAGDEPQRVAAAA